MNPPNFFLKTATGAALFCALASTSVGAMLAGLVAPAAAFEPIVSLGGEHRVILPNGNSDELLATKEETDGLISFITLSSAAPGDGPGPAIVHANEAEFWYVLEGTYEFHIGDKVVEGGPGTFIAVDKGQPHGFISRSAGKILTIFSPGGYEHFFMDWAEKGLERGPELGKLEETYGVTRP